MRRFSRRQPSSTNDETPTINLTPLIDVVFVVLIVFILVAPLLELEKIQLAAGAEKMVDESLLDKSMITLHVRDDNTVLLNSRTVDLRDLSDILRLLHERYPTERPQLFQDRRSQFGTYQSVKNAAEVAGFTELDLILKPA